MTNKKDIFKNSISPDDIHKYFLMNQSLIKKNTVLFNQNEEVSGLYFILSGSVGISKTFNKEKILKTAVSGDIIGIESFFGEIKNTATAIVNENAIICFISAKKLADIIKIYPDVCCKFLIRMLSSYLTNEKRITVVSIKTVEENLKDILSEIKIEFNSEQCLGIPDKVIHKKDKSEYRKSISHIKKINYFQLKIKQLIC